jgi:dipeptidase
METTASSSQNRFFDPIRKRWVQASPEEKVRQTLIHSLLQQGVSPHHILVEVDLRRLPTGSISSCRGRRRIDLLVARFTEGSFTPLLLAECKASDPSEEALEQLLAYQSAIQSRWLLLASPSGVWSLDTYGATPHRDWLRRIPSLV